MPDERYWSFRVATVQGDAGAAIDAVFPAASELVMLYGGALASGALTHEVDVFGWHASGAGAYAAVVVAGLVGRVRMPAADGTPPRTGLRPGCATP